MSVTVRLYHPGDEIGICEAHRLSLERIVSKDYTPQEIAVWVQRSAPQRYIDAVKEGERFLVLDDDGRIGGFAGWIPERIRGFYLHPDYAGRGLGKLLFQATEKDMRANVPSNICHIESTIT